MMSYGLYDLRLARALADRQLATARRMQISMKRRPSARGAPPECSDGRDRVGVRRPAPGAAAGN